MPHIFKKRKPLFSLVSSVYKIAIATFSLEMTYLGQSICENLNLCNYLSRKYDLQLMFAYAFSKLAVAAQGKEQLRENLESLRDLDKVLMMERFTLRSHSALALAFF
jgi:hypothetical protein